MNAEVESLKSLGERARAFIRDNHADAIIALDCARRRELSNPRLRDATADRTLLRASAKAIEIVDAHSNGVGRLQAASSA